MDIPVIVAQQPVSETLYPCFRFFHATDKANAAVHGAEPKWSPITFRLMESITTGYGGAKGGWMHDPFLVEVATAWGTYEEDKGR